MWQSSDQKKMWQLLSWLSPHNTDNIKYKKYTTQIQLKPSSSLAWLELESSLSMSLTQAQLDLDQSSLIWAQAELFAQLNSLKPLDRSKNDKSLPTMI